MADQGNRVVAYDSLRSMLRALDEEDEATPMPGYDGPDWQHPAIVPPTGVVCRYERVATSDAAGAVRSSLGQARIDPERSSGRLAGALCFVRLAAPAAGLLLAGALFIMPTPNGQWARAALEELGLEESTRQPAHLASAASHQSAEPAEAGVPDTSQSPTRGIQAFAEQARRALAVHYPAEVAHELSPQRE